MLFFALRPKKHLDIRRDMKKFLPVGCCIDRRQKSRGSVKIRLQDDQRLMSGLRDSQTKTSTP